MAAPSLEYTPRGKIELQLLCTRFAHENHSCQTSEVKWELLQKPRELPRGYGTWHTNKGYHSRRLVCSKDAIWNMEPWSAFWREFASAYTAQLHPLMRLCDCCSLHVFLCFGKVITRLDNRTVSSIQRICRIVRVTTIVHPRAYFLCFHGSNSLSM